MNYITCFCHLSASFLIFNDVKQEKEGLALKKKSVNKATSKILYIKMHTELQILIRISCK